MTRSVNYVERFGEAVAEGRPVVGTEITLTDPLASEAAAEAGSDFLWIETEHAHLDLPSVLAHSAGGARRPSAGPGPRRLERPRPHQARHRPGAGRHRRADGLHRRKRPRPRCRAFRYPPEGVRGWGPVRNMMYFDSADDYVSRGRGPDALHPPDRARRGRCATSTASWRLPGSTASCSDPATFRRRWGSTGTATTPRSPR